MSGIPRQRLSYSDIASSKNQSVLDTGKSDEEVQENVSIINLSGNEIAFVAEFIDKEQSLVYGEGSGQTSWNLSAATGSLTGILNLALPRSKREQIKRAYHHVEHDDLLSALVEVLVEFASIGFSLQAQPTISATSKEGENEQYQEKLNALGIKLDIRKLQEDLLRDWFISGSMVLYWRMKTPTGRASFINDNGERTQDDTSPDDSVPDLDPPKLGIEGLEDIAALNPGDVEWDNSLGRDVLTVKIPDQLQKLIKDAILYAINHKIPKDKLYKDLKDQGIPRRWVDAVRENRDFVQLLREEGDNWIIRTKGRKYAGLAVPTMLTVFLDLEMRKILKEGDTSASIMMKHFIMLIKQGESIETGPMTGHTTNWLKSEDAKKLLRKFSTVNKAIRAAVNHTTKIEFVFPPKEMFTGEKYIQPEKRIFNWSGVAQILMTGEGGKYSAGFLNIKRMISKISKGREEIDTTFMAFFAHPTIEEKVKPPKNFSVGSNFDTNVLKDPMQLLKEVQFLYESGIGDPRTAARELERNPDTLKSNKLQSQKENKKDKVWSPLVNENEPDKLAGKTPDNGGRPANPGTNKDENTRLQRPIARQTVNTP